MKFLSNLFFLAIFVGSFTIDSASSLAVLTQKSYEIKEIDVPGIVSGGGNLKMECGETRRLYLSSSNKHAFDAVECSAFVVRDNYYHEYLLPQRLLRNYRVKQKIAVCSAKKSFFIGIDNQRTSLRSKKCQFLQIRAKDSQYAPIQI
jgi:hypothetical protein